uniref:Ubiquitin-like protease family profile domain-containing protein n=1 Tax=Brassica oleracea var. oleracea TaxID=109376 RepID=A0A0D3E630_BRAOL
MSDGFGTCFREIKLLGDRMGAVEKKVRITKKGSSSDDLQLTKPVHEPGVSTKTSPRIAEKRVTRQSVRKNDLPSDEPSVLILDKQVSTASDLLLEEARRQTKKETAMVNLREKSERERKLAPTQQTPFKGNNTAKQIIPNKKVGRGYDPFAPYDKKKSKELTECLEEDRSMSKSVLSGPSNPLRMADRPCKSSAIFLLLYWRASYPDFKSDKGDANGLGRRLPGGAWNYYAGEIPSFCQSKKVLGVDVDDIYAPVNFKNQHWFAIWISIPKRHIVVWDSIIKHIIPEELDEPYTYERQTVGVPQCRAGDCDPFTLKYIECYALGMEFPKVLCPRNGKTIREKMAVDIFQELPMCHEWENQDNDENLG